jgi:ParB family chromosome partitioning protein
MAKAVKKTTRRRKTPSGPVGLTPREVCTSPPKAVEELCREIQADGGAVIAPYRDPLGGHWLVLAALPLEQVEPTPYQRKVSDAHVKRLSDVIARTGRFLDPVIAVRVGPKQYQTPNGGHRTGALKLQGARSITALVVTEPEVARLILALNVEKAHNLREKSLEVIRLARELAAITAGAAPAARGAAPAAATGIAPATAAREDEFTLEFEEPAFLTLGLCYDANGRFGGGAYHPILKRVDEFLHQPLPKALETRQQYSDALLELDGLVAELVAGLKQRGLESPYLKSFVVARLNPLRFRRGATLPIEETLKKMTEAARKFKPDKITTADLARTGAAPPEEPS